MKTKLVLILLLFSATTFAQTLTIDSTSIPGVKIKYLDGEKVYVRTDSMPMFPGGDMEMQRFIRNNLRYPLEAQLKGIEGRVIIGFIVSKTGEISNCEVEKRLYPALDGEALRVVEAMPKIWTPATIAGQLVHAYRKVPITFRIGQDNNQKSYSNTDKAAVYPEGEEKMREFIEKNLKYPRKAKENNMTGTVNIRIMVDRTGYIFDYEVMSGINPELDKEAMRIVKKMPKKGWAPAIINDQPVNSYYIVPVSFGCELDSVNKKTESQ